MLWTACTYPWSGTVSARRALLRGGVLDSEVEGGESVQQTGVLWLLSEGAELRGECGNFTALDEVLRLVKMMMVRVTRRRRIQLRKRPKRMLAAKFKPKRTRQPRACVERKGKTEGVNLDITGDVEIQSLVT